VPLQVLLDQVACCALAVLLGTAALFPGSTAFRLTAAAAAALPILAATAHLLPPWSTWVQQHRSALLSLIR
jgi:hypothetical protein